MVYLVTLDPFLTNKCHSVLSNLVLFCNLGDPNGYSRYYLSANGSDIIGCGTSTKTTCKTLQYVLSIYYCRTHDTIGLRIVTSISLTIDKKLTVRHTLMFLK